MFPYVFSTSHRSYVNHTVSHRARSTLDISTYSQRTAKAAQTDDNRATRRVPSVRASVVSVDLLGCGTLAGHHAPIPPTCSLPPSCIARGSALRHVYGDRGSPTEVLCLRPPSTSSFLHCPPSPYPWARPPPQLRPPLFSRQTGAPALLRARPAPVRCRNRSRRAPV